LPRTMRRSSAGHRSVGALVFERLHGCLEGLAVLGLRIEVGTQVPGLQYIETDRPEQILQLHIERFGFLRLLLRNVIEVTQELAEGLELEAKLFSELFSTQDIREGTTAFLEKRSPSFNGA